MHPLKCTPHPVTHLYMETFSINSFVPLSFNTIPLGETFRVTFCSFFPLAFAFGRERGKGKLQAFNTDTSKVCKQSRYHYLISILIALVSTRD